MVGQEPRLCILLTQKQLDRIAQQSSKAQYPQLVSQLTPPIPAYIKGKRFNSLSLSDSCNPVTAMLTFIVLGTLLPHVAMAAPLFTGLQHVALQEDVNILVYGVLQFSKSLHDLYDSTALKLDRIWNSINTNEQRLGVLHRQIQRAQKDQTDIREVVEGLKVRILIMSRAAETIPVTN